MIPYIFRRFLLIFPTLFGVLLINFLIVQITPGGPIEQMIAKARGMSSEVGMSETFSTEPSEVYSKYQGARGLSPEFIEQLEKQYGFDKPVMTRFWIMIKNYMTFDFGDSYFRETKVWDLIISKLPVSLSLGLWSTLLIYLLGIPLGIWKAVRDGSKFDLITSAIVVGAYAIPSFVFSLLLIIFFAGGSYWDLFPLRGLFSDDVEQYSFLGKVGDYLWHIALPIFSVVISGMAGVTLITKNSFMEEIHKPYVTTARAKGLTGKEILYKHIFRNATLPLISRFPGAFVSIFFTSNLLIEVIFSLDGLGLLGFEAAMNRDYPVMFGSLYIFTLLSLSLHLIGDLLYRWVDPRITFEGEKQA